MKASHRRALWVRTSEWPLQPKDKGVTVAARGESGEKRRSGNFESLDLLSCPQAPGPIISPVGIRMFPLRGCWSCLNEHILSKSCDLALLVHIVLAPLGSLTPPLGLASSWSRRARNRFPSPFVVPVAYRGRSFTCKEKRRAGKVPGAKCSLDPGQLWGAQGMRI